MSDTYNFTPSIDFIFALKKEMKQTIIFASMAIAAGIALTNIYTSLVDVPSWGSIIPSPVTYSKNAATKNQRTCLLRFQNRITQRSPSNWFSGEKILKKLPGSDALKYCLAVSIEFGMLLPHDGTSTNEV